MSDIIRLLKLFKPYALWLIAGVAVALISALANITLMGVSGWFITAMGIAGVGGAAINYFTPAAIIRACAILRTGGRYAERLITHEATFRLIATLRVWFYQCLEPLAPAAFKGQRSGDIFSRMRSDIDTLERFYLGFLVPVLVALASALMVIAFIGFFDLSVALFLSIATVIALIVIPMITFVLTRSCEETLVQDQAELRTRLSENLQGADELALYDTQGIYRQGFLENADRCTAQIIKSGYIGALSQNSIILLSGLVLSGSVLMASTLFDHEEISGASLTMITLLTFVTMESFVLIPSAFQGLGAVLRSARRIFEISDRQSQTVAQKESHPIPEKFHLAFDKVCFSYDAGQEDVLKEVSFDLDAGKKVAIIGPSGAGKSSIVNLLMRFWEPQKGRITLGTQNIEAYSAEDIRAQFSVMEQTPYLFAATIKENLCLAKPDASNQELDNACRVAGLYDFIQALPQGYDTYIGEHGKQLSGGQVKRLALARALLKDAPCLILDEPGEGLDYMMEQDILNAVIQNLNGKTLILITHRAQGLQQMDQIIALEEGKIIQH